MIRMYVDFDGTITRQDVGDAMFERFGGAESVAAVAGYRSGELSAMECFRLECEACGVIDHRELDSFLDGCEIDPSFYALVEFARVSALPLTILSDGMDYYIERILQRNGITTIPFFANHLELSPAGTDGAVSLVPSFPFTDEVCDRCACCKRNHMISHSADDDIIVLVGEGYSDRCPARFADVVFAKDELLQYCREHGIPYTEYRSFSDVQAVLTRKIADNGGRSQLRKRRQADLARREVIMGE